MMYTAVGYAVKAIWGEILQFRFDYPLYEDPEAGPKDSLHYYMYSEKLTWDVMKLDETGVPRARTRLMGEFYRPSLIAWWGLVNLGHYLRHGDQTSLRRFLIQLDWLEQQAVIHPDGAITWPNRFDCQQGHTLLVAPWVSAVDHGFILSAIVRGYRLTKRMSLLKLLENSGRIFELGVDEGGVRIPVREGALYTELPGGSVPVILDGFMTALLGIYDAEVETGDRKFRALFEDGMRGLKFCLPSWNYRDKWTWYGSGAYLCPPSYHNLNRLLLGILGRLWGDHSMVELSRKWDPRNLSSFSRADIYARFVITKNAYRVRHRTWMQNKERVIAAAAAKREAPKGARSISG
jgi:hypothetical protein